MRWDCAQTVGWYENSARASAVRRRFLKPRSTITAALTLGARAGGGVPRVPDRPLQGRPRRRRQGVRETGHVRPRITPEEEADTDRIPAIQVPHLGEVGIAPKGHPTEPGVTTQPERLVEPLGRPLRRQAIARPVDDKQRLGGVGLRDDHGVVPPRADRARPPGRCAGRADAWPRYRRP